MKNVVINARKSIVVTGGGTGGHVFTAIAIGEELHSRGYNVELVTDQKCIAYINNSEMDFKFRIFNIARPTISFSIKSTLLSLFDFGKSLLESYSFLKQNSPDLVIACGGYSSFPLVVSARLLGIKFVLHEQNAVVGRLNRFFGRMAAKLFISFPHTLKIPSIKNEDLILSGTPVRNKFHNSDRNKDLSRAQFTLLVIGGSQGAKVFDDNIPKIVHILKQMDSRLDLKIIQQVRSRDIEELAKYYESVDIKHDLQYFFHDIEMKYREADLVICRSGAGTVSEVIETATPAIFIPYPHATDDHQVHNALNLASVNGSLMIKQSDMDLQGLALKIQQLYNDRTMLQDMHKKLLMYRQNSKEIIADEIDNLLSI